MARSDRVRLGIKSGRLSAAVAEVVGGFCHDLANDVGLVQTLLQLKGGAATHGRLIDAELRTMERMLKALHRFVRPLYRAGAEGRGVEGRRVAAYLREIAAGATGYSNVGLRVDTSGLDRSTVLPEVVMHHLVFPLVANAVEAVRDGKPRAGRPMVKVTMRAATPGNTLTCRVSDNGPGWGRDLDRLRKSLASDRRYSTKGRARGEGLLNVHRIVHKLGGTVVFSVARAGGAAVEIRLPLEEIDDAGGDR